MLLSQQSLFASPAAPANLDHRPHRCKTGTVCRCAQRTGQTIVIEVSCFAADIANQKDAIMVAARMAMMAAGAAWKVAAATALAATALTLALCGTKSLPALAAACWGQESLGTFWQAGKCDCTSDAKFGQFHWGKARV